MVWPFRRRKAKKPANKANKKAAKPAAKRMDAKTVQFVLMRNRASFKERTLRGSPISAFVESYSKRIAAIAAETRSFVSNGTASNAFFNAMHRSAALKLQAAGTDAERALLIRAELERLRERVADFKRLQNAKTELEYAEIIEAMQKKTPP